MLFEKLLLLTLVAAPLPAAQTKQPPQYRVNYVKKQLLQKGFSQDEIYLLLNDDRLRKKLEPVVKSQECAPTEWKELDKNMMSENSVRRGKEFQRNNSATLEEARRKHGVAPEYVAAVIRIESDFGNCLGNYSAFNVLYHNLNRVHWLNQANNLVALIVYCKEMAVDDCHEIPGSSAGAIGLPQFMPISLRFAEDGDGDGVIDLFSEADAIMSAANFLNKHGWRENKQSQEAALAKYYGSGGNYVRLTMKYAKALKAN